MMAIEIAIAIVVQCVKLYRVQRQRGWVGLSVLIHPFIHTLSFAIAITLHFELVFVPLFTIAFIHII